MPACCWSRWRQPRRWHRGLDENVDGGLDASLLASEILDGLVADRCQCACPFGQAGQDGADRGGAKPRVQKLSDTTGPHVLLAAVAVPRVIAVVAAGVTASKPTDSRKPASHRRQPNGSTTGVPFLVIICGRFAAARSTLNRCFASCTCHMGM